VGSFHRYETKGSGSDPILGLLKNGKIDDRKIRFDFEFVSEKGELLFELRDVEMFFYGESQE
jgi:hypothetical protein